MIATRMLEVIIEGNIQGKMQIEHSTLGIKLIKTKFKQKINPNNNLFKINSYYGHTLPEYINSIEKSLGNNTGKTVKINSEGINPNIEKLYKKYLRKKENFINSYSRK